MEAVQSECKEPQTVASGSQASKPVVVFQLVNRLAVKDGGYVAASFTPEPIGDLRSQALSRGTSLSAWTSARISTPRSPASIPEKKPTASVSRAVP